MTKSGKQYVSYEVKQIHCCRLGFQLFKSNTTKVKKNMWYGTLTKKGGGGGIFEMENNKNRPRLLLLSKKKKTSCMPLACMVMKW